MALAHQFNQENNTIYKNFTGLQTFHLVTLAFPPLPVSWCQYLVVPGAFLLHDPTIRLLFNAAARATGKSTGVETWCPMLHGGIWWYLVVSGGIWWYLNLSASLSPRNATAMCSCQDNQENTRLVLYLIEPHRTCCQVVLGRN